MARTRTSFDSDWRFALGEHPGAAAPDFDDGGWRRLDLPHDWSIEGDFAMSNPAGGGGAYLPAGIGWYRKRFTRPAGPVTLIEFDGIFQNCDVWCNGTRVGHHNYGCLGFELDLTDRLSAGQNTLAVRVDNSAQPGSRWYTGSGIYRHVWLTQAGSVRVVRHGVFVTTPSVTRDHADVLARVELTAPAPLRLSIRDAHGAEVASAEAPAAPRHSLSLGVPSPRPWSCEDPVLYSLHARVFVDGMAADELITPFGIRSIRFDADEGFFLNGVHTKLNGACVHHDGGCAGAAVPEEVWVRRLRTLKRMGCNAIRMAHNPPAPELLDLCDRLGFLVLDEAFDEWRIIKGKGDTGDARHGYGAYFDQDADHDLAEMVRRDRNHPSVVLWSIGNEIPEQGSPDGWLLAKRLRDICRIEDPSRPVTLACDNIKADVNRTRDEFLGTLDVIGVNYVNRWRSHAETKYAWERHRYPDRVLLGTENNGVGGIRGEYLFAPVPGQWWSKPYFSAMVRAECLLRDTMANDFICGDFMWTGIDYLGEARWPTRSAACGVIDTCGFTKDGYHLYRSLWTRAPMIHVFPHWNWEGREGRIIPVICYTNCATVELLLNGRSFGAKAYELPMQGMTEEFMHFDKPVIHATTADLHLGWDVPYEPGVLKAVGRDRGGKVLLETEVRTTGAPSKVRLWIDGDDPAAEVVHCVIDITDGSGLIVPTAENEIRVEVEDAVLIGVDNGRPDDLSRMSGPKRRVCAGKALALVRRIRGRTGRITVHSPGLQEASLTLRA